MLTKTVDIRLVERKKDFLVNWQKSNLILGTLLVTQDCTIQFFKVTFQLKDPSFPRMGLELKEKLKKRTINRTQSAPERFLRHIFFAVQKDRGYCPVFNLKSFTQFVPFLHFKMKGLPQITYLMQKGDWICKLGGGQMFGLFNHT